MRGGLGRDHGDMAPGKNGSLPSFRSWGKRGQEDPWPRLRSLQWQSWAGTRPGVGLASPEALVSDSLGGLPLGSRPHTAPPRTVGTGEGPHAGASLPGTHSQAQGQLVGGVGFLPLPGEELQLPAPPARLRPSLRAQVIPGTELAEPGQERRPFGSAARQGQGQGGRGGSSCRPRRIQPGDGFARSFPSGPPPGLLPLPWGCDPEPHPRVTHGLWQRQECGPLAAAALLSLLNLTTCRPGVGPGQTGLPASWAPAAAAPGVCWGWRAARRA